MASALTKVEISDAAHLKSLLSETDNPLQSIKEFQNKNAILLESLSPALPLLDLHGVTRHDFHYSVFEQLKLMLERRIEDIEKRPKEESYQTYMKILDKAFPLASAPLLRPLIMRVLTKIDNIPQEHLQALVNDPQLYKSAPLEVRRHIWLSDSNLFCQEVRDEIKLFTDAINRQTTNFDQSFAFLTPDPRTRRKQCPHLRKIVEMTRANSTLYNKAIDSIKTEFKVAPLHSQPFVASLRSSLLMALHESEHQEMVSNDVVYKFAWCIDACIRARQISELHQRELFEFLSTVRASKHPFDSALVLFDPTVQQLLLSETKKELLTIFAERQLPRSSGRLRFLLRLMKLGSLAPELAKNENNCQIDEIDDVLVRQLLTTIVIGLARKEDAKLSNDIAQARKQEKSKFTIDVAEFEQLWKQIISTQGRFSGQLLRLQLQLFPELASYQAVLPLFGRNCRDMLSDQVFLHEIGVFIHRSKDYSDEFLTPFMLKFLLSGKQAREFAAKVAKKLVDDLGSHMSAQLKVKIDEKINAAPKKPKEKKKDKKKAKEGKVAKNKSEKTSKKDAKLKIKLSLASKPTGSDPSDSD